MRFRRSTGRGPRRGIPHIIKSRSLCCALSALLLVCSLSIAAGAQSAADKATARQLATEGIGLFNSGNYADALDRMKRAQSLYQAPPHLLYIARSEVKLSQLVEAAEDYRSLVRFSLPPNGPKAFGDAVEAGKKELAELEPKIPTLQLGVEPANAEGVELTIDDKPVPAAAIGAQRPVNPGSHQIRVKAPGYKEAASSVDVKEAEARALTLTLEPESGAAAGATAGAGAKVGTDKGAEKETTSKPSPVGFLLGARLGLSFPTGTIRQDLSSSDVMTVGGGLELHGGVRFAKYFTPALFVTFHGISPSKDIEPPPDVSFNNSAGIIAGGFGVIVGTPRNQPGGFGELDIVVSEKYSVNHQVVGTDCDISRTWSGTALRLGGGAVIPFGTAFHLTPFAMASIGRFSKESVSLSSGCNAPYGFDEGSTNLSDADEQATHTLLFIGAGGDFVLGGDRPSVPSKK